MAVGRNWALAPVSLVGGLVAVAPFFPTRPALHGVQVLPPSEGPLLHDRHPHLRHIERDLASGQLSLADAVEIVLPTIRDNDRLCEVAKFRGGGSIRAGVALMLCDWVEKTATDTPEAVSDAILEQLHANRIEIGQREPR